MKWVSVIRAYFNRDVYSKHLVEQVMFRYLECSDCVAAGACPHCGCSLKGKLNKMADLKAECSDGRWGAVMPEDAWEAYKEKHNIKFTLTYNF